MKRLGKLVDRATESDRRFFERFPHRQHRVRHSHRGEIGQNEIVEGKPLTPPAGFRWFTAVRNVYSGARLRIFTLNAEAAEIDLDEATARRNSSSSSRRLSRGSWKRGCARRTARCSHEPASPPTAPACRDVRGRALESAVHRHHWILRRRHAGRGFCRQQKTGGDAEAIARDEAVVISLALQHGVAAEAIRHAVTRNGNGAPSSILGAVIDALAATTPFPKGGAR